MINATLKDTWFDGLKAAESVYNLTNNVETLEKLYYKNRSSRVDFASGVIDYILYIQGDRRCAV